MELEQKVLFELYSKTNFMFQCYKTIFEDRV